MTTPKEAAAVLSQPININRLTLKNRLVMGPMAATGASREGKPTAQTIAFFKARARGGVGMIIVSCSGAARAIAETPFAGGIRADIEEFFPDLAKLATAVHAHGTPIIGEISPSMGRMGRPGPGRDVISASPINVVMRGAVLGMPIPGGEMATPVPREATVAEIEGLQTEMVATADRLHRAGWDGVEIPAIMSYFLASFVSPRTNWRTDQYGGSVENRARMLVDIVKGIRERVGPHFVIGLRITANDYMPDGQGPEGFVAIAKEVEKAGIDYVALVYGCYESMNRMPDRDGENLVDNGDARVFKRELSVPVMLSTLHDPLRAARAIADGHGDLVLEARQMLADPDYAQKAIEGRTNDIVRCDRDMLCARRMALAMPVRCSVNPRMGRESRKPGELAPLNRLVKAPIEPIILRLTRSPLFMGLVGRFMKKPKGDKHLD
ncbi:NADH:flavin oxidoreductase (plasmid) [Paraburkholderia sprentiae WSM5005]|uniref:NADH:flavin oxidoreductase n=1 Tax=Paraburkholderia sprentiae WSM5005 TaxID=754502 RepID=A0A1I9YWI7_9BURK|nr:NADH:flavin oxidoreductase [Paraburkholderia sprentiae]APA90570.1 NADH:flavin oxidoreductase [Paraburkholderia sprentiae WSM5005]